MSFYDFSAGEPIGKKSSGGRKQDCRTYLLFTTNGYRSDDRRQEGDKTPTVSLSLDCDSADAIIDRYGNRVGIRYMHDTREIVIHEGDARSVSPSSGKGGKGRQRSRSVISLGSFRETLRKDFGEHARVYFELTCYDNCFVFKPTGEVGE